MIGRLIEMTVINSTRKLVVFILVAMSFLNSCMESPGDQMGADVVAPSKIDFGYISVDERRILTLHELKYAVSMDGDFMVAEPKNRSAQFNNTPYRISLAAFVSGDGALVIHAEEVADSSGASDYGHLPPATWPDGTFRSSGPDCLQIPAEEVEGEHDLLWLRENGFEPSGNIIYAQYFTTTADMNSEVIISIVQRVTSCPSAPAVSEIISEFQARTTVTKID